MCRHRASDRWSKWWERFLIACLSVFTVAETYGLVTVGEDAACTAYLRRLLGQSEPCRHTRLGRAAIVTFGLWLIAHFGWGRCGAALPEHLRLKLVKWLSFGFGGPRRPQCALPNQGDPR